MKTFVLCCSLLCLVAEESAMTEPAWQNAGEKPGLQIWRIVNSKVKQWPVLDYGNFFEGDSYIILNTYQQEGMDTLLYDIHFWIGKYSSQDEYTTAAKKTVELRTLLNNVPIQHREVQGHESDLFKGYFQNITYMQGGADSGVQDVKPVEYKPRFLHFHGDRQEGVVVKEVLRSKKVLDSKDVYILDLGLKLIQWNGLESNKEERTTAQEYLVRLSEERGEKCQKETMNEDLNDLDVMNEFYDALNEVQVETDEQQHEPKDKEKELYRLSDASGNLTMALEKKDNITIDDFDSKDVFIFDTKEAVFVWIGTHSSASEKKKSMVYTHNHLMSSDHPLVPVNRVPQANLTTAFRAALAA